MENEWLQKLKIGDEVYVDGPYGSVGSVRKVTRITKTMIIIAFSGRYDQRYKRNNGRGVGEWTYNQGTIRELTKELIDKIQLERLRQQAIFLKDKLAIPHTEADLIQFINALKLLVKE